MKFVIKRDGKKVKFNSTKIYSAIMKAMTNGSGNINEDVAQSIANEINFEFNLLNDGDMSISEVESRVINKLIAYGESDTARAYEGYRAVREFQRKQNTTDDILESIVTRVNDTVANENSNKNATINSTQRDLLAGEISKDIVMRKLLPTHLVEAHKSGAIHIHDMDYMLQPMTNCCLINIGDMLENGTVINGKLIKKPKSFQVACTVLTQIIAQVASNQYGGQSVDIKHLAPFVEISRNRYRDLVGDNDELVEKLTLKEVASGIQTIQYQVNTLESWGLV